MDNLNNNVTAAMRMYFIYGLSPGSFTTKLITGDHEDIESAAHYSIRENISAYIKYAEIILPEQCRGPENYKNWLGYNSCSDEDKHDINEYAFSIRLIHNSDILRKWIGMEQKYGKVRNVQL